MKPTEGTILTVVRKASEAATELAKTVDDPMEVAFAAMMAAKEALAKTPEQLPVLKQAGVVDAGGQGLVLIFEGFHSVFANNVIVQPLEAPEQAPKEKPKKSPCKFFATFPGCQRRLQIFCNLPWVPATLANFLQPSLDASGACKFFAAFPECQRRLQIFCSLPWVSGTLANFLQPSLGASGACKFFADQASASGHTFCM